MKRCILLLFLIPLAFAAPLVEIASPKASSYLSFIKESFPKAELNIIVYPKYRSPHISINGHSLTSLNDEGKAKNNLKKEIENALKQKESNTITVNSLRITQNKEETSFSFVPCNYSKSAFRGRWVAFVTEEGGSLLRQVKGKLEIPPGSCGRPINFSWVTKYKPSKLVLIVALFDEKGAYIISKSNREIGSKE